MAEIVNLRMARKRWRRVDQESETRAKRALHGMAKPQRDRIKAERRRAAEFIEGHRRPSPNKAEE